MAICLRVGNRIWEVGTSGFLHAFFSTASFHLEPNGWGTRFPTLMRDLYRGSLRADNVDAALQELSTLRGELAKCPPSAAIWDIENPEAAPPWSSNISPDITYLSDYFVTPDGRDLIDVIEIALQRLKKAGGALTIQ